MLLSQRLFRLARGKPEQVLELPVGHRQTCAIIEIRKIETERTVRLQINQVIQDGLRVFGLAVGGQPHQLVFAGVDLEPCVISERRIQQAEGMGEMDFPENLKLVPLPHAKRGGRPLAHAVHRERRRLFKGRGEKRARRMTEMMLGKQKALLHPFQGPKRFQFVMQQLFLE